ncbi:putative RTA1 domain protein [Leptodontidium sp. MPI-SDFR-AT-0119]|nr:putative RTA1 domain protein [Leptodontidium sp. MPI-SDFR-AT-0119]
MAVLKPLNGSNYFIWKYLPSLPAAAIFALLFFAITAAHSWKIYKTRLWFCIPIVVGGFMEFIGYAARIACHNDTSKLGPYIIQQMFILLPPVIFAASIYMVLGRIIVAVHGEEYSPIRPSRLTKTFLIGDIVSFYIQGGGGGLTAVGSRSTGSSFNFALAGKWIIIGGLVLQIVIFGLFCVTARTFHKRYESNLASMTTVWGEWKQMMHILYFASGLIMIRSLFRVVEYVTGEDGYLMTHEWPLFVFDTVLMFGVLVLFFFYHPSLIPGLVKGGSSRMRVVSAEEGLYRGTGSENNIQLVEQRGQSKY